MCCVLEVVDIEVKEVEPVSCWDFLIIVSGRS